VDRKKPWHLSQSFWRPLAGVVASTIRTTRNLSPSSIVNRFGFTRSTERADSVENGLAKVAPECDFVAIHDAARPCINADLVESVFAAAQQNGAAIPAVPVNCTLKRSADGQTVDQTVDRSNLYAAQTPQAFKRELIQELYENRNGAQPTDEAQLLELNDQPVALVPGSPFNIKITTQADLRFAKACLAAMPAAKFDAPIHPFADDNLFR